MKHWQYKWQVVASVIFGTFMVIMDATVVNVALPTLRTVFAGSGQASIDQVQWVISGFVLAIGIVTPMAGLLADRFGIKRVYLLSLFGFTIASALCGLAQNLPLLIVFRVLQGLAGGSALPLGTALLFSAFPPEERGLAFGVFGIPLVAAPALGPVIGGALVEYANWRYIFFVNVPIGLLGVGIGWWLLRESKREGRVSIDYIGTALAIIAFGGILYGLSNGAPESNAGSGAATVTTSGGWGSWQVITALSVGGLFLIAFIIWELLKKDDALLDVRLFTKPTFTIANLIGWISVTAFFGAEFLLPLYLQVLRGLTPLQTGLLLLPLAISSGVLSPFIGRIQDKIGPRLLVAFGFGLLIINTWQLSLLTLDESYGYIAFLLVLRGVALAFVLQPTLLAGLSGIAPRALPRASSLVNSSRSIFQSLGVAMLATILTITTSNQLSGFQPPKPPSFPPPPDYQQTVQQALTDAFHHAFLSGLSNAYFLTFVVAAAASIIALFLPGWPFGWKKSALEADQAEAQGAPTTQNLVSSVSEVAGAPQKAGDEDSRVAPNS
jgi:DHA2 family multidrug resistance protein